ncbi:MAG TPA: endo-1,4-beta-xylanase [Polyangiaceae bacterium]|jgi:GH35 family endo-1,4-beta-xylanase|nr:endo-1,4-beta-xylanase [Polyangiaceae bacterium]
MATRDTALQTTHGRSSGLRRLLGAVIALVAASELASCIRREPSDVPVESAPAAAAAAPAARDQSKPTGLWGTVQGADVLDGKGLRAFAVSGDPTKLDARWMPVSGQSFPESIRTKSLGGTKNPWDVQLRAANATPIAKGDVLLAHVRMRTEFVPVESGEGMTELVFELGRDPWTKSVTLGIQASSEWKEFTVPFVAEEDYGAGEGQFVFRMGYPDQTIELADISLENYGQQLTLADMPKTKLTYPGREPDAPWRAEAQARIEKNRKADLQVVVKQGGQPVPSAQVSVQQTSQAFNFGTCAPAELLLSGREPKVNQLTAELFNTVTLENDLKWAPLAGDWGGGFTIERAQKASDWLREHNLRLRGHVLMWPGWGNLPAGIKRHAKEPDWLKTEIAKHITDVAGQMRGRVIDWDVLNEPFTNHDLIDILGKDAMVEWFRLARQAEPNAHLYINDFAILSGGGGTTGHRDHYEATIQYLVDHHAELDGIAFQGHFGTALTSPDDLLKLLDRYGKFGKHMAVTEYDLLVDDEQLAADYTRDFYTLLFSYPQVESIVMWGFWDKIHWKKNAPLYHTDWSPKPALAVYKQLVQHDWQTHEQGTTDAQGAYATRGFLGDYDVKVTAGGKTQSVHVSLKAGSAPVVINL